MKSCLLSAAAIAAIASAGVARAAYMIEVDTDGLDNGVLVFNTFFAFGGDTSSASQSVAGAAFGMTGGDSIFGGNGTAEPDTYLYFYSPAIQGDNLAIAPGTDLGNGSFSGGLTAGGSGLYNVYASWPTSTNVSGGLTTYTLEDGDGNSIFSTQVDQLTNGNIWVLLGTADLDAATRYVVRQTAGTNTFVSMRASGVLFDPVIPEPAALGLISLASVAALRRRA
jgi:hypothetical protein